jgi:outer membrane lipoprotein-sorting protein
MRMLKIKLCVILFVSSFALMSQTEGYKPLADEAAFKQKFKAKAAATQTIKSDFIQEKNMSVLSEKITSKGTFQFKKEDKVRMEYTHPFKYLLVINKDKVMIKDEQKTNTFSTKNNKLFEHINNIIIDCVQGTAMDNKGFSVKLSENENYYLLTLVPLKKEMKEFFSTIYIYVDKKDYSVHKMDMREASGDNTVITFINKQINVTLSDEIFAIK